MAFVADGNEAVVSGARVSSLVWVRQLSLSMGMADALIALERVHHRYREDGGSKRFYRT